MNRRLDLAMWILLAGAALFLSGCATPALWDEERFSVFHEASLPPNLAVYKKSERHLVVYDERKENSTTVRRRAYWLNLSIHPQPNPHKPPFVSLSTTNGLVPVAILATPASTGPSVVAAPDTRAFTFYTDGVAQTTFDLPIYSGSGGRILQVALTPFAVVLDATILGMIYFIHGVASGGFSGTLN